MRCCDISVYGERIECVVHRWRICKFKGKIKIKINKTISLDHGRTKSSRLPSDVDSAGFLGFYGMWTLLSHFGPVHQGSRPTWSSCRQNSARLCQVRLLEGIDVVSRRFRFPCTDSVGLLHDGENVQDRGITGGHLRGHAADYVGILPQCSTGRLVQFTAHVCLHWIPSRIKQLIRAMRHISWAVQYDNGEVLCTSIVQIITKWFFGHV